MTKKLFCFGLGYTARALTSRLASDADWIIAGTCRSPDRQKELIVQGIEAHVFNGTAPLAEAAEILSDVTHLLISTPPEELTGDPVLASHAQDIAKLKNLQWVGYLSTTGVYGDHNGGWVDDDTPETPSSRRGELRLEAEKGWLELLEQADLTVHLFRLGSIYGPGRGQYESLKSGRTQKIVKKNQYFSRIHVEDIVQVLLASMDHPNPGCSYNVVDDLPAPPDEVIDYVCDLMSLPRLPEVGFDTAELSPLMRSFYSESKRVRNDRIKSELGVKLNYPTYREGFAALVG
ncbi:SDR family oxidoreductase [Emcibacter nanhaiensis]|uniref:SDR family oxidoreductase n=1 Tax=Emcibacter nanhaiensis TaxID=1505037 RepID=A0A501PCJ5_9PROT|nr:SDR family oxidoreductase [Emcibacter nanhaiensis]TPD57781.1 SDR family oxidoreductase [Emcibacter nanhaiensis]